MSKNRHAGHRAWFASVESGGASAADVYTGDRIQGGSVGGLKECSNNRQDGATGRQCCGVAVGFAQGRGHCAGVSCGRARPVLCWLPASGDAWTGLFKRVAAGWSFSSRPAPLLGRAGSCQDRQCAPGRVATSGGHILGNRGRLYSGNRRHLGCPAAGALLSSAGGWTGSWGRSRAGALQGEGG